ncbi:MAG: GIY-YIG nuclease family protein [Pseudomonadota bacterium]
MHSKSEIDYLNDELLISADAKPKAARTPVFDRALEVLERINEFVEETGTEPVSESGRGVHERMLANELAGLRASKDDFAGLEAFDVHGIVFQDIDNADPLDDPLLADAVSIFEVRDELKPIARPDYIAKRTPCPDFHRFEPLFESVRKSVEDGSRKPQGFRQERVDLGEFFVLKGQLIYVADVHHDPHRSDGKLDARLRVIFDNATESNLLMSSLVRRLYEDKDARRIGSAKIGPLFEGARTGIVYILRSLSDKPEAQGLLKVGTTSGAIEDRIARAEAQSTFLFAPVVVVETIELFGHSAKEAEQRIHRVLKPYHVTLRVTGPDGRTFKATEWFKASTEIVDSAIRNALK